MIALCDERYPRILEILVLRVDNILYYIRLPIDTHSFKDIGSSGRSFGDAPVRKDRDKRGGDFRGYRRYDAFHFARRVRKALVTYKLIGLTEEYGPMYQDSVVQSGRFL